MSTYYYSMLGMVRARDNDKDKWIVEVSYKDEDVDSGPYKTTHKWHYVGECTTYEELNDLVLTLTKEETKREIDPNHPDIPDIG
jgi:hypothetical protein